MNISCYLRKDKPPKDGAYLVEMRLAWGKERIQWSTEMRAKESEWDDKKQRFHVGRRGTGAIHQRQNDRLAEMEAHAVSVWEAFRIAKKEPNREVMLNTIKAVRDAWEDVRELSVTKEVMQDAIVQAIYDLLDIKKSKEKEGVVVSDFWQEFIDTTRRLGESSKWTHKATLTYWREYCGEVPVEGEPVKNKVLFNDLDQTWVEGFMDYLMMDCDLAVSSARSYWGAFCNIIDAADTRLHIRIPADLKGLKIDSYESVKISHTEEEFRAIYNYVYPTEELRRTAHAYVFASTSGLRFSDMIKLTSADISQDADGRLAIRRPMKKTGKVLEVKMSVPAQEIWRRYGGNPLGGKWKVVLHIYNNRVKKIGELVGINEETVIMRKYGNDWREIRGPKYQFMSSHKARHTFAMFSLNAGMSAPALQKLMGHSSLQSTMTYAVMSEEMMNSKVAVWDNVKLEQD